MGCNANEKEEEEISISNNVIIDHNLMFSHLIATQSKNNTGNNIIYAVNYTKLLKTPLK